MLHFYRKWQAKKINEWGEKGKKYVVISQLCEICIIKKMGMTYTQELQRVSLDDGDFYFLCCCKSKI